MVEATRLFSGSTELSYSEAIVEKTSDYVVNNGNAVIEANSAVTSGSVIEFRKADGITVYFEGQVVNNDQPSVWSLTLYSKYGFELMSTQIQQVYAAGTSPEAIVEDVIDNNTNNLTFASTSTSGFSFTENYVAKGYLIDIIKEMMDLLDWQLRIDDSGNTYFEPLGNVDNGFVFTDKSNIQITKWLDDDTQLVNRVRVTGALIDFQTQDSFSGDASETTFTLTQKPSGVVKATVDAVEITPTSPNEPYKVDQENKQIIFSTGNEPGIGVDNVVVDYAFKGPVVVDQQDDASIAAISYEIFRELDRPYISSFADARKYAQQYLSSFSTSIVKSAGFVNNLQTDRSVGELVSLVDNRRNRTAFVVIEKIRYVASENRTYYEFGRRLFVFFDWQREVEERIKKIERRTIEQSDVAFSRLFTHTMNITLSLSEVYSINYPTDSFILGHQTLGRLRTDLNFEADCSDTGNHGSWTGSDIGGSQYITNGYRLSAGSFNGSDNFITVSTSFEDSLSSFSVVCAINPNSIPGSLSPIFHRLNGDFSYPRMVIDGADDKLELSFEIGGVLQSVKSTSTLTTNTWYFIVVTYNSTADEVNIYIDDMATADKTQSVDSGSLDGSNNNLLVGANPANGEYFDGYIDEFMVYNDVLTQTEREDLQNKEEHLSDLLLWWSMDNPRLGDRFSDKIPVNGEDVIQFDLSDDTLNDSGSTADWDTTNERIAMSSSSDQNRAYNTIFRSKRLLFTGKNFATATIDSTEVTFGNDLVKYFLSADGESNYEEFVPGTNRSFDNKGNDLYMRVVFIGNGASSTYLTALKVTLTR